MSNLEIYELNPSGVELFEDSESYLPQLDEAEMTNVLGGLSFNGGINVDVNASETASLNTVGNSAVGISINANSGGNDNSIQIISAF